MPTDSAPPMVRKNIVLAVATPRCFQLTALCTAMMSAVFAVPMPRPSANMERRTAKSGAKGWSESTVTQAAMHEMAVPTRTSARIPTRVRRRPLTALAMGQPTSIGATAVPASAGVPPSTACT